MTQSVIIIGATSGIGRELALCYARAGWRIAITGRRQDLLDSFRKENKSVIEAACFDVTGNSNISHISDLVERLGGLDLLIYNSGFGEPSEKLDWNIDKKTVSVNVNGFVEIVNWSYQFFFQQGHGHIAATSSVGGNRGSSFAPAYSASKAFMSTYMEGLYMKSFRQQKRIYITDVQPGFVDSKEVNIKGRFWIVPLEKAARQIYEGIESRRFRVYVSRRWRLIAMFMKVVPVWLLKRFA